MLALGDGWAARSGRRGTKEEPSTWSPARRGSQHEHWYEQEMVVLKGEGVACTNGTQKPMHAGAVLWVAPRAFRNYCDGVLRFRA